MRPSASIRWAPRLAASLLFVALGFAFIPQAGIEDDEALFGSGIYATEWVAHSIKIGETRVPLMIMSYVGTLKALIYTWIFHRWKPSPYSIRVPVLVAGAVTIWLVGLLLQRLAGNRAALIGLALLCTDTSFLLTTCYDWGPVALQHLLLVSGVLSLLCFHQENRYRFLFAGFFFFGLGMWDKALFIWMLSGMSVAALLVFPKILWNYFNLRTFATVLLGFALGAAPIIRYNVREPLATFRGNTTWDASDLRGKTQLLTTTFSGQTLFGYIARNDPEGHPREPATFFERLSVRLSDFAGHPENGLLFYAFVTSLAMTVWLWRTPIRKPVLFFLTAAAIAWLQMLFAKGVGGAAHHVILLWPFPTLIIALAFDEAARRLGRYGAAAITLAVCMVTGCGLLITNEYLSRFVRNGTGPLWTDAIYPLSDFLRRVKPGIVYIDDWGMLNNLQVLNRGALPLHVGADPLSKPVLNDEDHREILRRLSGKDSPPGEALYVGHPDGAELFPGVNAKLRAIAAEAGYRQEMVATIPDRNGRTIFEIVRFVRLADLDRPEHHSQLGAARRTERTAYFERDLDRALAHQVRWQSIIEIKALDPRRNLLMWKRDAIHRYIYRQWAAFPLLRGGVAGQIKPLLRTGRAT